MRPLIKYGSGGNQTSHISVNSEHQSGYYYKAKTSSARCYLSRNAESMLAMMRAPILSNTLMPLLGTSYSCATFIFFPLPTLPLPPILFSYWAFPLLPVLCMRGSQEEAAACEAPP